jgi:alpha/beta superfamily hydrolase
VDEPLEQNGELLAFVGIELGQDRRHQPAALAVDLGVPFAAAGGHEHHDDSTVVGARPPLGEACPQEALHRAGRRGRIDAQRVGEIAHPPRLARREEIERVELAGFECIRAGSEEMVLDHTHRGAPTELHPSPPDPQRHDAIGVDREVDRILRGHRGCRVQVVGEHGGEGAAGARRLVTPLEALEVIARQDVLVTPSLRHMELYTMRGLLSLLWHAPPDGAPSRPAAVVACGGAMGGLLGPADGLYHQLGVALADQGVQVLRVSYRRPNDIDACTLDLAAAVQLAAGSGADRIVTMGHSFGGAVAIRVAVGLPDVVAGVVTFSTQSAGCEAAAGLGDRPLLLFHGDRDEILPLQASEVVRAIAGTGDLVVLPGDGHLLAKSAAVLWERLGEFLPATLGLDLTWPADPPPT